MKNIYIILLLLFAIIISVNSCTNPVSTNNPLGWGIIYPSPYYWPVWSKDGKTISFLYLPTKVINSSGGQTETVPDSAGIWFINPDGANQRFVSKIWGEFDLSYDNKWIVFEANRQIFKLPVYVNYIDTTNIFQLTTEGNDFFPTWSPNGSEIIYDRSLTDSGGTAGSWLMMGDGSKKHLELNAGTPSWYPDGKSIIGVIGVSPTSIETRFVKYPLIQGNEPDTLVVKMSNRNDYPHYSPDGTKIIFQSQANGDAPQICIIDTDGTNFKQLTTYGGEYPSWAPDSKRIVYVKYNFWKLTTYNGTLWILDTSTGEEHQLTYNTNLIIK